MVQDPDLCAGYMRDTCNEVRSKWVNFTYDQVAEVDFGTGRNKRRSHDWKFNCLHHMRKDIALDIE